jgi:hypothetical protein
LAKELKKRNLKRESDLERIEEVRLWGWMQHLLFAIFFLHPLLSYCNSWKKRNDIWNIIGS